MKVNVVYAHPAADSYSASLHQRIVRTLSARGDEVIDFDLYAMQFDPVMGEEEWRGHEEPSRPPPEDLKVYIDALHWAEACVFCFPTCAAGRMDRANGHVWAPSGQSRACTGKKSRRRREGAFARSS